MWCTNIYLIRSTKIWWLCLVLTEASKKKFLELCKEGDIETVKTLLAEDPSLINCRDWRGKFRIKCWLVFKEKFLELCSEGDLETIKICLLKIPLLSVVKTNMVRNAIDLGQKYISKIIVFYVQILFLLFQCIIYFKEKTYFNKFDIYLSIYLSIYIFFCLSINLCKKIDNRVF